MITKGWGMINWATFWYELHGQVFLALYLKLLMLIMHDVSKLPYCITFNRDGGTQLCVVMVVIWYSFKLLYMFQFLDINQYIMNYRCACIVRHTAISCQVLKTPNYVVSTDRRFTSPKDTTTHLIQTIRLLPPRGECLCTPADDVKSREVVQLYWEAM